MSMERQQALQIDTFTLTTTAPTTPQGIDRQLSFWAVMAIVDNLTAQYLYLPDADAYVPPFTTGAAVLLRGGSKARARFANPPGITAGFAVSAQEARISFVSERIALTSGVTQAITNVTTNSVDGTGIMVAGTAAAIVAADSVAVAAVAGLRYLGFTAKETAAAAATATVHHGATNAGPVIDHINLAANETTREWYGPEGIAAPNGIFFELLTGAMSFGARSKTVA